MTSNNSVKWVKTPSFNKLLVIAYNWRLENGGLKPITIEDHIRNIHNYCDYAKHLN